MSTTLGAGSERDARFYWGQLAYRDHIRGTVEQMCPEVRCAYEKYFSGSNTKTYADRVERASRCAEILRDLCGDGMNPQVPDVLQLWSLVHSISEPNRLVLAEYRAIKEYLDVKYAPLLDDPDLKEPAFSEVHYTAQILSDKPKIEQFWKDKFPELYPEISENSPSLPKLPSQKRKPAKNRTRDILQEVNVGKINNETWLADPVIVSNLDLADFCDEIQIESPLIAATYMLDALTDPPEGIDERTLFRQCILAESLLVPICRLLDFDRLADALKTASVRIRYTNGGREDLIRQAEGEVEKLGTSEQIDQVAREVINYFGIEIISEKPVTENEKAYNLHSRMYHVRDAVGKEFSVEMRVKSVGARAQKIRGGAKVLDSMAFTFITDEYNPSSEIVDAELGEDQTNPYEQMEQIWHYMISKTNESFEDTSSPFRPEPSTSRTSLGNFGAISIEGMSDFIEHFKEVIHDILGDNIQHISTNSDRAETNADFHTVKVTGLFHDVPVEIQVKTRRMRQNEQSGRANHRRHETPDDDNENWEHLVGIGARREQLSKIGIFGDGKSGLEYLRQINSWFAEAVGSIAVSSCVSTAT
ncbi:hypothetical protein FWC31_00320 [Candidatus Saccharibacteria bacterium]|nr:hypothetical protein [Candidatus Saccharibacteria bacterium]